MICKKCGKENRDNAVFCTGCGMKLGEDSEKKEDVTPQKQKSSGVKIALGVIAIALIAGVGFLGFQFLTPDTDEAPTTKQYALETDASSENAGGETKTQVSQNDETTIDVSSLIKARPSFLTYEASANEPARANVPSYAAEANLGNVVNQDRYYLSDEVRQKLEQNLFVVEGGSRKDFHSLYEENRYFQLPNFVTVDSLMHTYHLYFSYLLQNTEKTYLAGALSELSKQMLAKAKEQYGQLKGTEWEDAAKRNMAFFAVGASLQDSSVSVPADVQNPVAEEINRIMAAEALVESTLTGDYEDYSQYKPRGYYEGNEILEQYFRTMMWYGRIGFKQEKEDLDRSAVLMTLALRDGGLENWESLYLVTSFFAGSSDDLGYYEYMPLIEAVYGSGISAPQLAGDTEKWNLFHQLSAQLAPPAINSTPIVEGENNVLLGFRFMGQRFSVDADIMQRLVYQEVGADSAGGKRMLPDALDVPAALGSDTALGILEAQGDTGYAGYTENMTKLREKYASAPDSTWTASLYANWLNTLRPLLEEKGEGYPSFMQSTAWATKSLETFLGSYAELKHDTVLYSKQIMAEMGGGDMPVYDDRGYVQPEPTVYERFAFLAEKTAEGLRGYGMLSEADAENLSRLSQLAKQLQVISEKELRNETLADSEYELIRNYGGTLEHFWSDAMKGITGLDEVYPEEYPCPLVVDVATDPNGSVLELATGGASTIYVVVPVDGTLRIASGTVYSFYQFEWPMSDRMTDAEWRQMMGYALNENNEYSQEKPISQPEWTQGYRVTSAW